MKCYVKYEITLVVKIFVLFRHKVLMCCVLKKGFVYIKKILDPTA